MEKVANNIEKHQNLISSISQPLAVIGLEKTGQVMAGKLLTPAVWALNYSVNGKSPDKIDVGLYGFGLMGGPAVPASIATGVVKAMVDDDMEHRLKAIRASESPEYSPFIAPCYHFNTSPPQINAMTIASIGGTAWQHPNGLWVYIIDRNKRHVPNFQPRRSVQVYQPVWPLKPLGSGRFRYTIIKP